MKTLREATADIVRNTGVGALHYAHTFVGTLLDVMDVRSIEASVLNRWGDDRLIDIYAQAADEGTPEALRRALIKGASFLHDRCATDETVARSISFGLAQGIADATGVYLDVSGYEILSSQGGFYVAPGQQIPVASVPQAPVRQQYSQPVQQPAPQYAQQQIPVQQPAPQYAQRQAQYRQTPVPSPQYAATPKRKSHAGLVAFVSVLVVAVAGICAYIFLFAGNGEQAVGDHDVTISYNSNGADTGAYEATVCTAGESMLLPDGSKLTRRGYYFAGWGEKRDDNNPHTANEVFATSKDVTLYAQWRLDSGQTGYIIQSNEGFVDEDGNYTVVAKVTNTSPATMDLTAQFVFKDSSGNSLESKSDTAWSVGPGESTWLKAKTASTGVAGHTIDVNITEPEHTSRSLQSCVTIKPTANSSGLTLTLKNVGSKKAAVFGAFVFGKDSSGTFKLDQKPTKAVLEPGESLEIEFSGSDWQRLTYEYCSYGYAVE